MTARTAGWRLALAGVAAGLAVVQVVLATLAAVSGEWGAFAVAFASALLFVAVGGWHASRAVEAIVAAIRAPYNVTVTSKMAGDWSADVGRQTTTGGRP